MRMRRMELYISFSGKKFYGFDAAYGQRTVQSILEQVLQEVLQEKVDIEVIERIMPGCSVRMMPVFFSTMSDLSEADLLKKCNLRLEKDLRILAVREIPDSYRIINEKMIKDYEYRFLNCSYPVISYEDGLQMIEGELNLEAMQIAAGFLIGENDFSSFTTAFYKDPYRTIYNATVTKNEDIVTVRISGNGFLDNMVQMLTGELIRIGREELCPIDIMRRIRMKVPDKEAPEMMVSGLSLNCICPAAFRENVIHNNNEFADYYIVRSHLEIDGTIHVVLMRCEDECFSAIVEHAVRMAYGEGAKRVLAIDVQSERIRAGERIGPYKPLVILNVNSSEECMEFPLYGTWYWMKEEKEISAKKTGAM